MERGRLSVRSCNCTQFVFHPVWWPANTFDGNETTHVHQMEVLPTVSERSSLIGPIHFLKKSTIPNERLDGV